MFKIVSKERHAEWLKRQTYLMRPFMMGGEEINLNVSSKNIIELVLRGRLVGEKYTIPEGKVPVEFNDFMNQYYEVYSLVYEDLFDNPDKEVVCPTIVEFADSKNYVILFKKGDVYLNMQEKELVQVYN